jgi:Tfp pilus assembly protein PilX
MEFLIVLAILAVVALFVMRPVWQALVDERRSVPPRDEHDTVAELEAARDAKYREIRDAELDHRTGKLSQDDYDATDRSLRAEAIEILRALDRARARNGLPAGEGDPALEAGIEQLPSRER